MRLKAECPGVGSAGAVESAGQQARHSIALRPSRLKVTLPLDGRTLVVSGRLAQTLDVLRARPHGVTAAEAAALRRLSDYVLKLRRLGVPITTSRELSDGARIGRYHLAEAVKLKVMDP